MTDKEIIKALESEIHLAEYVDSDYCSNVNLEIIKSALDLITRQREEIERLKAHINEVADKVEDRMTYMSGCQNLIQTVKKIILGDKTPSESLCDNCGLCKEREEEAVKEFAERLKKVWFDNGYESPDVDFEDFVDNLVKEMAGDTE